MITLEKCPFKGRTYFFDLRYYRNQEELSKNIKKLGGKIETFLCEDVTHVITDKPNYKSKGEQWTPGTPKSHLSVPSPANDSGCYASPLNPSPINDGKQHFMSRGQALVQKAKLKNQGCTDIYGRCDQLNIKVLSLQRVLSYIDHYKELLKKQKEKKKPKPFSETLIPPFIKIEDNSRSYRPVYKSLMPWKNYFSSSFLRVAAKIQEKYSKNMDSVFKPMENLYSGPVHNQNAPNTVKFVSPNLKPLQNHSTKKQKDGKINEKDKLRDFKRKKDTSRKLYCEICSNYFRNIEQHLQTTKHKEFQVKIENFRSVYEITSSLPTIDQFLKKNKAVTSNESGVGDKDEQNKITNKDTELNKDDSEEVIEASCPTSESSEPFPWLDNFKENSKSSGDIKIMDRKQILEIYAKWSQKLSKKQLKMISKKQSFFKEASLPSTVTTENPNRSIFCHEVLIPDTPVKTESTMESELIRVSTSVNSTHVSNGFSCNQSLENDSFKRSNVHVNVMDFSHFAQTSCCDDSENVMLNINGCPIPKYPFRNFGFGVSSKEKERKHSSNKQSVNVHAYDALSRSPLMPVQNLIPQYPSYDFQNLEKSDNLDESKFIPLSDNICDNFKVNDNLMFSSVALPRDDDENIIEFQVENKSDGDDFKMIRDSIDDLCQSLCLCNEQPIDLSMNHGVEVET